MKYRTIVADPPWPYKDWPVSGAALREAYPGQRTPIKYPTLSVAEITALPIADLTHDDAHLYLWTTNRYLRNSYDVAEAWGFRFAQILVWAKTPRGIGPGGAFSNNAEFILFCRKGSPGQKRRVDSVWFNWPRMGAAHSRKPEAFLDLVESVSHGPYLELFARRQRLGWETWGDQALEHVELIERQLPTPSQSEINDGWEMPA